MSVLIHERAVTKTCAVLLVCGVAGIMLPRPTLAIHRTAAPRPANDVVPVILSNQFILAGEVIARDATAFTVLGVGSQITTIQVNSETSILKGAESIQLAELMPGDKVSVTVMRVGDGSLQAVKIEVRTGYE